MGEARNEVSRIREAGDHPPGRAVPPGRRVHFGQAGHSEDHLLSLVRSLSGLCDAGLEDRNSSPGRVWNRIPDDVRGQIIDLALEETQLSPRELAVRFTDTRGYFISEASVYRLLKAHDLITSPAFVVIKAADEFRDKTTAPNQLWQTDFTYLKVIGWGWFYLSTILDDYSRYIIAWKLCTNMTADDVTATLKLALEASGCNRANVVHKPRLLSDNGSSYISGDLVEWLEDHGMDHVRGAPYHPQTQGKIERWHQTLKNRILLENYYLPGDLENQISAFVDHYNNQRYHESIGNVTPADAYFGRHTAIIEKRKKIKKLTCPSHLFHLSQKPWNFASPPDTLSGMHKIIEIFADRAALHTEILALRQQVAVLKRKRPRPSLRKADRVFWVILSCLWPGWRHALVIVRPETVIGWHRKGFRLFWTWKSRRGKPGRPPVSREIRHLVRRMSRENTRWGAPRIHGELLKLGFSISQAAVSKYMVRYPSPPSQSWRTFLTNHADCLASIDFFVVPTATFHLLFGFIVLHHERRQIVHFGVTANPTMAWVAQQIREAFPWGTAPRYLIRDRDGAYGQSFRSTVTAMGVEEVVTAPRSPWQNPYVERLIGSVRRECLDHSIILNERHLRRILGSYLDYYHGSRTHLSLGKDTPDGRPVQPAGSGTALSR